MSNTKFDQELYITVDIKNTGKVAGKEVVQLYLSAPSNEIDKPNKELKAFAKTGILQPGETQTVYMRLDARDLASYNPHMLSWVADKGEYTVFVGASVSDIRLKEPFVLLQDITVERVNNVLNCTSLLKNCVNNNDFYVDVFCKMKYKSIIKCIGCNMPMHFDYYIYYHFDNSHLLIFSILR